MTTRIHWTESSEGKGKARATHEAPVVASLGFRAAAAADRCASLARLLSPVLDVLIRLWLAEGFLVTDALQHMLPGGQVIMQDHLSPSASSFAWVATTSFGIFVQTICPVLLAVGLFTRFAALALLLQVLVLQMPAHATRTLLGGIARVDCRARTRTALA
jgi:uncharacterized membrane protein YphA (DoxX/SURF4 family)